MRGPDLDFLATKVFEAIKDASTLEDVKLIMALLVSYTQKAFLNVVYGVQKIPENFLEILVSMALAVIILYVVVYFAT